MKNYAVHLGYYGCTDVVVKANSSNKALELAEQAIAKMSDSDFCGQCMFERVPDPTIVETDQEPTVFESQDDTVTLWCRVTGTIEVPKQLVEKMIKENKVWLDEFDSLPFNRDYSDDYVPEECIPEP